jgi:hypothetical protein
MPEKTNELAGVIAMSLSQVKGAISGGVLAERETF